MTNAETVALGLAAVAAFAVPLLREARLRLAVVVLGALFVFQSSSDVSPQKLGYLLLVGLFTVDAIARTGRHRLKRTATVVGGVVAMLSLAAVVRGNAPLDVARDASNYVLLLASAPLALHFGREVGERTIARTLTVAGVLSTYAFTAAWAGRRGFADLPSFTLPSGTVAALFLSWTSARAVLGTSVRARTVNWATAVVIIVLALSTGTRTTLIMLTCPLVVAVVAMRARGVRLRRRVRRSLRTAVLIAPLAGVLGILAASQLSIDIDQARDRLATIFDFDKPGATQSLDDRSAQQSVAWSTFKDNPVIGAGPGYLYRWIGYDGKVTSSFAMDTSLVILSKWGIIGAAAFLALLRQWWRLMRPRSGEVTRWGLAAAGFAPFVVLTSVLGATVEDRGIPLALILLGAGSVASKRRQASAAPASTAALTPA